MADINLCNLLEACPMTWVPATYNGKNYVIIELDKYSTEYLTIQRDFVAYLLTMKIFLQSKITSILRVQNPFAYGRFLLRKEQLQKRNAYAPTMHTSYVQIDEIRQHDAIEYNLDKRRTPFEILNTYNAQKLTEKCILIVNDISSITSFERDSEIYPEYIIKFGQYRVNHLISDSYICF